MGDIERTRGEWRDRADSWSLPFMTTNQPDLAVPKITRERSASPPLGTFADLSVIAPRARARIASTTG